MFQNALTNSASGALIVLTSELRDAHAIVTVVATAIFDFTVEKVSDPTMCVCAERFHIVFEDSDYPK